MSLNLDLSDVSSCLDQVVHLWQEYQSCDNVLLIAYYWVIQFGCPIAGEFLFVFLMKVVFARLIHCKVTLSSSAIDKYLCGGTSKQGKYPVFLQALNSFIHLFTYVEIYDVILLRRLKSRTVPIYLNVQISPDVASENPFKMVSPVF